MNRLQYETSPYLLQHAANPVDWYPWGEEAFDIARRENKPVLVSIGYSSCHWCHVMEHESFESAETAALMNELFVCIKVDREEYPDVDHVYMNAVQAMTGSGGWPLNVFTLPDKRPFFGGTYFPPVRAYNRASWREVLINISQYFTQNRDEVEQQAGQLTQHLQQLAMPREKTNEAVLAWDDAQFVSLLLAQADREEGGFGGAPKFPSTFALNLLWQCGDGASLPDAASHVLLSLTNMACGGLYDQLRGGFSRYSTDRTWFAPHFEKMLYDNALLLPLYAQAWHRTKEPLYWRVMEETLAWLETEMSVKTDAGIGFYSAQDADSEGEEGKYYTWTAEELRTLLGADYTDFAAYYGVQEDGNWEHRNILFTSHSMTMDNDRLMRWKELLLTERYKRIAPLRDDKVLLGWNALMNKALQEVYVYTGLARAHYLATENMRFLQHTFVHNEGYWHTWKNGVGRIAAYADDLAYWAEALVGMGHIQGNATYYSDADKLIQYLKKHFQNEGMVLYDFTHHEHRALGIPHRDTYDGALPSANAVLAGVLYQLGYINDSVEYQQEAERMVNEVAVQAQRHPSSFAYWLQVARSMRKVSCEVSISGTEATVAYFDFRKGVNTQGIRFKISALNSAPCSFSVCRNGVCFMPETDLSTALGLTF